MLSFTYTLIGHGWCTASISDVNRSLEMRVSHLSDALCDLTSATIALLQGAEHAVCSWEDEPGEYRWLFDLRGDDVCITIVRFDKAFSRKADSQGAVLFTTVSPLRRFANQVLNQLWQIIQAVGIDGYQVSWGYSFPRAEYETLENLIRNHDEHRS